ncbi:hypothetical protein HZA44_00005, partial [Candidatus Peregrinibacteria bacterium]|nr:hypothetical protein [Candidatus Peregrinibacteria bacterium]
MLEYRSHSIKRGLNFNFTDMQVVLVKRVPKLGHEHDVVDVSAGYA